MKENKTKIAFLCDRKKCKDCSYQECKHTTDIKHAKNFVKENDFYKELEQNMKVHDLKILPEHYMNILNGNKSFELRKNDRNYHVGDFLRLREWERNYTGKLINAKITYVLEDETYLQKGYVALGIKVMFD